jgi:hypothetical protein
VSDMVEQKSVQVPDLGTLRMSSENVADAVKITATVDLVPARLVMRNGQIEAHIWRK